MEFRCSSRIHAIRKEGLLEVKCRSKACGAGRGVLVFHYFNPNTGALVKTKKFRDAELLTKGKEQPQEVA